MKMFALFLLSTAMASSVSFASERNFRHSTDSDGVSREISLCARPSPNGSELPGHAFVAFGEYSSKGAYKIRAIGHTVFSVKDAILSFGRLIPAKGAIDQEIYTSIKQSCLTLLVNKDQYDKLYQSVNQPLSSIGIKFDENKPFQKTYSLGSEDCIDYMLSIARTFASSGLVIPKRSGADLPLSYMRKLIDAN